MKRRALIGRLATWALGLLGLGGMLKAKKLRGRQIPMRNVRVTVDVGEIRIVDPLGHDENGEIVDISDFRLITWRVSDGFELLPPVEEA